MTDLTHSQIEELLGAFCLDAVEADERDAIEAHLRDCPRCRAEVADLREVAALLANNDDVAPEGVWHRIAEAIDGVPPPMRLDVRRRKGRDVALLLLSAAAVVALVVLGWQVHDLRNDNHRVEQQLAAADAARATVSQANLALLDPGSQLVHLTGTAGDRQASAVLTSQGAGYFFGLDLAPLESGVYELWGSDPSGSMVSLGSMSGPGVTSFQAPDGVRALLVTVEREPVPQPTTAPIMQGTVA